MVRKEDNKNELLDIEVIPDQGIVLSDGTRLSAKVWRPKDYAKKKYPVILEYIPYRKTDGTQVRDALTHPYFSERGYICLRVDLRGNGDSEGLLFDEYTETELSDAEEVISWAASQRWSNGNVGMMGISWGGFNSLQLAARKPKALKAIITLCSTVNRYTDDIHYKGGCLLNENLGWGATMLSFSSRPPDPLFVGERWRELWLERLDQQPHLSPIWLQHQSRDEYWKHGSICEDYSKIEAPTLAIGGWGDAYKNAVPALLENLSCPRKGIVGPWVHKYPHFAVPEPRIGFLQETLRWWDKWLKNIDNGVEKDPDYRLYVMDGIPPKTSYETRPGNWIKEEEWPSKNISFKNFELAAQNKLITQGKNKNRNSSLGRINSTQICGLSSGEYCAIWLGPEWPGDQRFDDSLSLCFDSDQMDLKADIVGAPIIKLRIKANKPFGQIAVRLCDVAPDGTSSRITYGVLNLKFINGFEESKPLVLNKETELSFELDHIAYRLPKQHKLRVAISNTYWPLIWPEPESAEIEILKGSLKLPTRTQSITDEWIFPEPILAPEWKHKKLRKSKNSRKISIDYETGVTSVIIKDDFGSNRDLENGLVISSKAEEIWSIHPNDPLSAFGKTHWTEERARDEWSIRTETYSTMTSDKDFFYLESRVEAFENNKNVFEKKMNKKVKRLL